MRSYLLIPAVAAQNATAFKVLAQGGLLVPMIVAPTLSGGSIAGGTPSANFTAIGPVTWAAEAINVRGDPSTSAGPVNQGLANAPSVAEIIVGFGIKESGGAFCAYVSLDKPVVIPAGYGTGQLSLIAQEAWNVFTDAQYDSSSVSLVLA